jgi:putative ABC transport system permease protein
MWRATWKGLLGHKLRVLLTGLAIVLGVGLVAGSYVFTDTLTKVFDDLFADAFAGIDVQVRAERDEDLSFAIPERLDESLVATVAAVEGVADAVPGIFGFAQLIDPEGEPVGGEGPPTIGLSWSDRASPLGISEGAPPRGPGELVVDAATARRAGLEVGDRVQLVALGDTEPFDLVGLATFAGSESFGGATLVSLEFREAQRVFGAEGEVDAIAVVGEEGIEPDELVARLSQVLPEGVEAVDAATAAEEQLATFKQALSFLNTFLLVFGMVALFVGAFLIQNTFQIVVAQRTRELALLRALGASRRQVTGMVLGEALLVSIAASLVGVVVGVGLAALLRWGFELFGGNIPSTPLQVRPRTVLTALAAGTAVTLVSAFVPARRAGRIPPLAAMREAVALPSARSLRRRAWAGAAVTGTGLGLLALGLTVTIPSEAISPVAVVGAGAGVLFIGVAVLAPTFARPLGRGLGAPLPRVLGATGRMAQENAVRSPRRTSATASALMIGVALIGLVTILAASLRATTDALLEDRFRSDLIVQAAGFGGTGMSPAVAERLASLPEVASVVRLRQGPVKVGDDLTFLAAANLAEVQRAIRFDVVEGSFQNVGADGMAVSTEEATERGWSLGDTVELTFGRTGTVPMTIGAVYALDGPGSGLYLDLAGWDANFVERTDQTLFVVFADRDRPEAAREAVEAVALDFPGTAVLDQTEFRKQATDQLNGFVLLVFALLSLALVIAFFGIANTLLLSVSERTREIGLLRAVGTTRRQIRQMVTWEAVIISVFGALLGVAIGIFFGWAVVQALGETAEIVLRIPAGQLTLAVVLAAIAGVVAAVYPARRASRLNVLQAIAYE